VPAQALHLLVAERQPGGGEEVVELLPFCRAAGLGVIPWGPLGAGFLSGRYRPGGELPEGSRIADAADDVEEAIDRRGTERNFAAVQEAEAVAAETGATVPQVAIAWLLAQPGVTAPIIGPRTPEQLADLLPAAQLELSDDQVQRLSRHTEPPASYPTRMNVEQNGIDVTQISLQRA